jgi:hypothetical protein
VQFLQLASYTPMLACCMVSCLTALPEIFAMSLQQYVPLFLTKEDLDVAVGGAYRQRNASQISAVKEKAAQYKEEYQAAMKEVGTCVCCWLVWYVCM